MTVTITRLIWIVESKSPYGDRVLASCTTKQVAQKLRTEFQKDTRDEIVIFSVVHHTEPNVIEL